MRTIEIKFVAVEYVTIEVSEEEFEQLEAGDWVEDMYDRAIEEVPTHYIPDWEIDDDYNDGKGYDEC